MSIIKDSQEENVENLYTHFEFYLQRKISQTSSKLEISRILHVYKYV